MKLCEPSSALHIAEDRYRPTAVEDLIGVPDQNVHHRRLHEGLDKLLEHKEDLEAHLKNRLGKAQRIWVMDRGMTSAENLRWLKEGERKYIVGAPRSELKRGENEILDRRGWQEIREDIEVEILSERCTNVSVNGFERLWRA